MLAPPVDQCETFGMTVYRRCFARVHETKPLHRARKLHSYILPVIYGAVFVHGDVVKMKRERDEHINIAALRQMYLCFTKFLT